MRNTLLTIAVVAIILSLFLTGAGGLADMTGSSLRFSKEHAWNDGVYLALVAIFFVLVAGLQK